VRLFTVGHSNHPLPTFVALLEKAGVALVVDVRRFPRSRRHPHFSRQALAPALEARGIAYRWLVELGGMREEAAGSPHRALAGTPFAGYADHMATAPFRRDAELLIDLAQHTPTAAMCAEADPQHCHRRFLADWLATHGVEVEHLLADATLASHELHPALRIQDENLVYDRAQLSLFSLPPKGGGSGRGPHQDEEPHDKDPT
jgi:uncharacterized protein (DUF488 family)